MPLVPRSNRRIEFGLQPTSILIKEGGIDCASRFTPLSADKNSFARIRPGHTDDFGGS